MCQNDFVSFDVMFCVFHAVIIDRLDLIFVYGIVI